MLRDEHSAECERCLGTGEWFVCQYQDYCEDDCLVVGCPDCGAARIDGSES